MSPWLNLLLAGGGAPALVLGLWKLANFAVHAHGRSYARDVQKIHGGRPRPLPHQEVSHR